MSLFDFFQDRRFRSHRIMAALLLPISFAVLIGLSLALYFQQEKIERETRLQTQETSPYDNSPSTPPDSPSPVSPEASALIDSAIRAYAVGNSTEARKNLSEVNLVRAGSSSAWLLAGLLKEEEGQKGDALELYSKGISSTPDVSLYYRRALLYRDNNALDSAMKDFDRARNIDPSDVLISNERLLLLIQMGYHNQVLQEINSHTDTGSAFEPAKWIFGQVGLALENNDFTTAREILARAQKTVDAKAFSQMLKNPVIARHQTQPDIQPFYAPPAIP